MRDGSTTTRPADGDALQVRNPSAYHVTLSALTLADGTQLDPSN